jgi:glycosyltransferase involved in cell wall biosynthesis
LSSYPPALRNLDSTAPRVLWTDCNFAGMPDFYHPPLPHSRRSLAKVHQMEQEAISQCSLIVYSSQWAADTLIANYDVDPSRVKVVPFGPNLVITHTAEDIERIVAARPTDRCNLVWIGTDGGRKRSGFAVEVVKALNQQGLPTHLTIIGIEPEPSDPLWSLEHVTCLGFLDKSRTDDRVRFEACLSEAHFLIHPAEAEAFGMVLCEAISHGVPCLASAVGGIPTIVKTGVTGHLFSPDAPIAEYCDVIHRYIADPRDYRELTRSAFHEFEIRLNWPCAARQIRELIEEGC